MARLVIFVIFCAVLGWVLSFSSFKKITPNNSKFDMAKAQKEHQEHIKLLAMMNKKEDEHSKEEEQGTEKKKVVELALTTEKLKRGYSVYFKLGKCSTCHGKYGEGKKSQKAPRLAGQHEWYLSKQLTQMKSGIRVNAKMNPYLKKLSKQDFEDVSHYLSKLQPWPL